MAVKLKDQKLLPPDHKIFKVSFFTVSHNTSERKSKNPNKVELIRFPKNMGKEKKVKHLVNSLQRQGWKLEPEEQNQRISKNPPHPRKKAEKLNTSFLKKAGKK